MQIAPVKDSDIGILRTPILVGPRLEVAREIGHYLAPLPKPLREQLLFATGRGVVTAAVEMLADRQPAIRFACCPDVALVVDRLAEIGQPLIHLTAAPVDAAAQTVPCRCRICGCTLNALRSRKTSQEKS